MREIKFRAWDKKWKKMYYELPFAQEAEDILNILESRKDQYIFMQYTGLKDKNGKEIYEGDIIGNEDGIMGVVHFNAEPGCFLAGMYYIGNIDGMANDWTYEDCCERGEWNHLEIYGNIYENPEILS
jgi:uncharacterized phage protein (TIGR01671 family)